eukprot:Gb_35811 [translate_table: standard]
MEGRFRIYSHSRKKRAPGGQTVEGQFFVGFYSNNCPAVEYIVRRVVSLAIRRNPTLAGALLRLHFHDCFVLGCDASILLDDAPGFPPVEKTATPNLTVRGYEVIDIIKSILEARCPGIVSCADILAIAARDAVVLSGGPTWQVPTGRRDGRMSSAMLAVLNMPPPQSNATQLTQSFLAHGMSQDEMITLSGAHTIGLAHCSSFTNRLYSFNATVQTDPSLDPVYASWLKEMCPPNGNPRTTVPLDPVTPFRFDNSYYHNLAKGKGLLTSDQDLHTNSFTQLTTTSNIHDSAVWELKFCDAIIHMSSLNIQTGLFGEVRRNCRRRN